VNVRSALFAIVMCAGCESFFAPHESNRSTVEGCSQAVDHLRSCCPQYGSYISCTAFNDAANANARSDLSEGQSRCLAKKPCDVIAREVAHGGSLCSFTFLDHHCKEVAQ
jgi:hypothetical protein